ncbi:helix-turn-helix transcriptional regulator [Nakamurella aerolata]|uniref:WYL domain-containing protein n=1 Tax=Nakamurella aerolata TaxID=1656892 RepID=A0A849ADJ9_9ACTN|nr:WYL domain-containing protein [Nakamurella aerolata]NNG37258.1 WYL domain-containing protein [Nakamurella aerolata]
MAAADLAVNPTVRALRTLQLLQEQPGITAGGLARELAVSERAARRYVQVLREADIAVETVRGRYGGYRLGRGLRLPPLVFGSAEALGLVMAVLDGHHAASDPDDPVGVALGKIIRALPAPVAAQAEAVRRTAAAAPDPAAARPDPAVTATLVAACSEHRRVTLDYRSESGRQWQSDVDPWGVVVRHGRWYLLNYAHRPRATRAYRVDRVSTVTVSAETFTPPAAFDPVAFLERHLSRGWEYATEVILQVPLAQARRCLPGALGTLEPLGADRTRLTGTTSNPYWYAEQLAATPGDFTVLGGTELQQTVAELARRLTAAVP